MKKEGLTQGSAQAAQVVHLKRGMAPPPSWQSKPKIPSVRYFVFVSFISKPGGRGRRRKEGREAGRRRKEE